MSEEMKRVMNAAIEECESKQRIITTLELKVDALTKDLSKSRELVGRLEESVFAMADDITHYYESQCLPTKDEYERARAALELIGGKK